jgi:hypothetical protein
MAAKVKIFGVDYEVREVSTQQLYDRPEHKSEKGAASLNSVIGHGGKFFGGLCDGHNCNLFINSNIKRLQKRRKIFIHEVLEAIDQEAALGMKHNQIEQIANGLLMAGLINTKGFVSSKDDSDGPKKRKKRAVKKG